MGGSTAVTVALSSSAQFKEADKAQTKSDMCLPTSLCGVRKLFSKTPSAKDKRYVNIFRLGFGDFAGIAKHPAATSIRRAPDGKVDVCSNHKYSGSYTSCAYTLAPITLSNYSNTTTLITHESREHWAQNPTLNQRNPFLFLLGGYRPCAARFFEFFTKFSKAGKLTRKDVDKVY